MSYADEVAALEEEIRVKTNLAVLEAELSNAKASGDVEAIKRIKEEFGAARRAFKIKDQASGGTSLTIRPSTIEARSGIEMPGDNIPKE